MPVQLAPPGSRRYRWYGLIPSQQADFSAGMYRSVAPHLIPQNGAYDIRNGLLDEDGSVYRRGGTTYRSTSAFGTGLTFIWDGTLAGGQRTVVASPTAFGRLNGDGSVTSLGGGGLTVPHRATVVNGVLVASGGTTYDGTTIATAGRTAGFYTSAGGRLVTGEGSRAYFSARQFDVPAKPLITDPTAFGASDFQAVPDGAQITGLMGLRDNVVIFTTGGVWLWSNIELDLVDASSGNPQQRLDRYSSDLVLWGDAGLAAWEGGIVVPALDAVWVMTAGAKSDVPGAFRRVSDPIATLYRSHVTAGYQPGLAGVYRGHYFLPILSGSQMVDMLVCKLSTGSWTRLDGFGAQLSGVTLKVDPAGLTGPVFMGAGTAGRVLNLSYFEPSASVKNDADGTAHRWSVTSRDIMVGSFGQPAQIRKARAWYELEDDGDMPTLLASFGSGASHTASTTWGAFSWGAATWADTTDVQLVNAPDEAPADTYGINPYVWELSRRGRFIRWRLKTSKPSGSLKLRSVELFSRASGRR